MSDYPAIHRNPSPFLMLADDQPIPGRDDLADFVQPGESDIDPNDFIKPSGVYDVTPLNIDPEAVEIIRQWRDRLREVSPMPVWPPHEEAEL